MKFNMNTFEAIEAIQYGKKVCHETSPSVYLCLKSDSVVAISKANGCTFATFRSGDWLSRRWAIYEEPFDATKLKSGDKFYIDYGVKGTFPRISRDERIFVGFMPNGAIAYTDAGGRMLDRVSAGGGITLHHTKE